MTKCQITMRVGEIEIKDEVPTDILDSMTPYVKRRAFGTLMEKIYKAIREREVKS